jgi:hypothetical protein
VGIRSGGNPNRVHFYSGQDLTEQLIR